MTLSRLSLDLLFLVKSLDVSGLISPVMESVAVYILGYSPFLSLVWAWYRYGWYCYPITINGKVYLIEILR